MTTLTLDPCFECGRSKMTEADVSNITLGLVVFLEVLSPEQRKQVFESLSHHFCRHCGSVQPSERQCQCWNDE